MFNTFVILIICFGLSNLPCFILGDWDYLFFSNFPHLTSFILIFVSSWCFFFQIYCCYNIYACFHTFFFFTFEINYQYSAFGVYFKMFTTPVVTDWPIGSFWPGLPLSQASHKKRKKYQIYNVIIIWIIFVKNNRIYMHIRLSFLI